MLHVGWDPAAVALWVRITARVSAFVFFAALAAAAANRRTPIRARAPERLLVAFLVLHTIHFGTVVALAAASTGENIHVRGGWPLNLTLAAVFYLGWFVIWRVWRDRARGIVVRRRLSILADAGAVAIATVFLQNFASYAAAAPAFGIVLVIGGGIVAWYLLGIPRLVPKGRG